MKLSLKDKLKNLVQERGEVSYGAFAQFCAEEGYKISGGERRMRELMDTPDAEIEVEMATSRRGTRYIGKYVWRGAKRQKITYVYDQNRNVMVQRMVDILK